MLVSLGAALALSDSHDWRLTQKIYDLMFILLAEQIVACRCIVLAIILKAVKEVLLRVSEFVFDLAHYEIIDLLLIV